jgi:hypothetical protein
MLEIGAGLQGDLVEAAGAKEFPHVGGHGRHVGYGCLLLFSDERWATLFPAAAWLSVAALTRPRYRTEAP